jgi:hypothetical protein
MDVKREERENQVAVDVTAKSNVHIEIWRCSKAVVALAKRGKTSEGGVTVLMCATVPR